MSIWGDILRYNPATAVPMFGYDQLIGNPMDRANAARAGFDPSSGMPSYPGYVGLDQSAMTPGPAANKYTANALAPGMTKAGQIALNDNSRMALQSRDQLNKQALGEAAGAKNAIAMKGGLNGGQATRINMEAGNRALELGQGAMNNAANNQSRISMEDAGQKDTQLLNAENLRGNYLDRVTGENARKNAYNLGGYSAAMGGWAANKQAQATLLDKKKA